MASRETKEKTVVAKKSVVSEKKGRFTFWVIFLPRSLPNSHSLDPTYSGMEMNETRKVLINPYQETIYKKERVQYHQSGFVKHVSTDAEESQPTTNYKPFPLSFFGGIAAFQLHVRIARVAVAGKGSLMQEITFGIK